MTTDVINGVPRELLERVVRKFSARPHWDSMNQGQAIAELRKWFATAQPADHSEHALKMVAQPAADGEREAQPIEVIGYASPGQVEILRKLPRTGGMKVSGRKNERYSEPVVLLSSAISAVMQAVIRCEQAGAFKTCMECGYQDGHDEICQYHESKRAAQPQQAVAVTEVSTLKIALAELHKCGVKPGSLPHMVLTNLIDAAHKTGEEE